MKLSWRKTGLGFSADTYQVNGTNRNTRDWYVIWKGRVIKGPLPLGEAKAFAQFRVDESIRQAKIREVAAMVRQLQKKQESAKGRKIREIQKMLGERE
jgi:hypothetical protein